MSPAKQRMQEIIEAQPDDASFDDIVREFAFERMIDRGLEDARKERLISDEGMHHRIRTWEK